MRAKRRMGRLNKHPSHPQMNSHCKSIVTAFHLRWLHLLKTHKPLHQFIWLAADQTANKAFEIDATLAPSNLRPDLIAPTRSQRKLHYRLT